jgi:hypothetical protein
MPFNVIYFDFIHHLPFIISRVGVRLSGMVLMALNGPLFQLQMKAKRNGASGGMRFERGNWNTWRKPQ